MTVTLCVCAVSTCSSLRVSVGRMEDLPKQEIYEWLLGRVSGEIQGECVGVNDR